MNLHMGSNLFPNLIPTSSQKWHCYSIMKGSSSSMVEGSLTELQLMVRKQRFLLYQNLVQNPSKSLWFFETIITGIITSLVKRCFCDDISFSRKTYFFPYVLVFVNFFFTQKRVAVCVRSAKRSLID